MSNKEIIYRFATDDDRELIYDFALQAIANASIPAFAADVGADLQERISEGEMDDVLLAIDPDTNQIVGYIEIDRNMGRSKDVFYIMGIYVLPPYRRLGVGTNLLKKMHQMVCKNNEELRIRAFTKEGVRFWESLNFKIHHYSMQYTGEETNT